MFECTSSVAISENLLQGFLVVFHHVFLVLARLGIESRQFISGCLELQQEQRSLNHQGGNLSLQPRLSSSTTAKASRILARSSSGLALASACCYGRQMSHLSLLFGEVPFFLHPFTLLHTSFGFLLPMFRLGLCLGHKRVQGLMLGNS